MAVVAVLRPCEAGTWEQSGLIVAPLSRDSWAAHMGMCLLYEY